jgi:catechol 2,3-dioxygenase-like lactoylglutathione lyase family enzyme
VSPGSDLVPQRLERAAGTTRLRNLVAERRRDGVTKVGKGASEELPARLELRAETEESERVVARNIHAAAELVQQRVERAPTIERQSAEPRGDKLRCAFVHVADYGERPMSTVNVRYMVDDVDAAVAFYTTHLGFTLKSDAAPAFADVTRGDLRLLLSGATSSAGRPMPDGRRPASGGWNRFQIIVDDITTEVARLRAAGVKLRNEIVKGPGGSQILVEDPSGNVIEIFQPR